MNLRWLLKYGCIVHDGEFCTVIPCIIILLQWLMKNNLGLHAVFLILQLFHQFSNVVLPSIVPSPVITTFSALIPQRIAEKQSSGFPSHEPRLYSSFSSYDSITPGSIGNLSLSVNADNTAPFASSSVKSLFKNTLETLYSPSGTRTLESLGHAIIAHWIAFVSSCTPSPNAPKSRTFNVTNSYFV